MRKKLAITLLAGAALVLGSGSAWAINQWPDTGITECFDNDGTQIACDGSAGYPSQDGSHTGPARDYVDNGDGTVTDNVTGLMWVQDGDEASGMYTWQSAQDYITNTLNSGAGFAGYIDWRLPTVAELATLVDHSEFNPALSEYGTTFTNSPSGPNILYWSDTDRAGDSNRAWVVNFTNGNVGIPGTTLDHSPLKTESYFFRAVRDIVQ